MVQYESIVMDTANVRWAQEGGGGGAIYLSQ